MACTAPSLPHVTRPLFLQWNLHRQAEQQTMERHVPGQNTTVFPFVCVQNSAAIFAAATLSAHISQFQRPLLALSFPPTLDRLRAAACAPRLCASKVWPPLRTMHTLQQECGCMRVISNDIERACSSARIHTPPPPPPHAIQSCASRSTTATKLPPRAWTRSAPAPFCVNVDMFGGGGGVGGGVASCKLIDHNLHRAPALCRTPTGASPSSSLSSFSSLDW
jgi:hypothetical protein